MRKFISFIVGIMMLLSMQTQVFALQSDETTAPEIKSREDVLWIRENGTAVKSENKTIVTDRQESLVYKVDTYVIEEKGRQVYLEKSGAGIVNHKKTIYEVWSPRAGGSNMYEDYDVTYSVWFRLTVDYIDIRYNGKTFRQMTTVSGSYFIEDTQMRVTAHSYQLGQAGPEYPSGEYFGYSMGYTLPLQPWEWERSVSESTFPAIGTYFSEGEQGARYYYTITRLKSGSSWSGYIEVQTI